MNRESTAKRLAQWLGRVVLLALAYFVTGKLGLLLAIPPGYASAVWPPSGIALAGLLICGVRCWPGVVLGSMLTNLSTSFDASNAGTITTSLFIALAIGCGAALQAGAGSWLIRRYVGFPCALTHEREIFKFFALGGPIACLTNASIGVAALLLAGAIPPESLAYSWWTWWVGDTIGALIFAPLAVMWWTRSEQWAVRRGMVTTALAVTFGLAVLMFVYTSHSDWNRLQYRFKEDATTIATTLERRLDLNIELLRAVNGLFAASTAVERDEFTRFAQKMTAQHPELRALEWVPRIPAAQRQNYEARIRREVPMSMGISERRGNDVIVAGDRDEYFPIEFAEPDASTATAVGFDIGSEALRRITLDHARDSGMLAVTAPVRLLQSDAGHAGFLLVMPIYDLRLPATPAVEQRRQHLRGYAIAVFRASQMAAAVIGAQSHAARMHFTIIDSDAPAGGALLFDSAHFGKGHDNAANGKLKLEYRTSIEVGDRTWVLTFHPTLEYLAQNNSLVAWIVLAGGLMFTALVGAGALLLTGRTVAIAAVVQERTAELAGEREFLKTVLENLDEGILVFDMQGRVQMSNNAARVIYERITGRLPEGRDWGLGYELYLPGSKAPMPREQRASSRALQGERVSELEVIAHAPGRPPLSMVSSAQPLMNAGGQQRGAVGVLRDITEAQKADLLKREFVATVSHELRTPLTSIRGSLGLIAGGAIDLASDQARKLIEIAYRNTDRLTALINDLLDMERIETGRMQFEFQRCSIGSLVQQAVEANQGYAQSCDVHFVLHTMPENTQVSVDRNRFMQVMANLLSNAAKFSAARSKVEIICQLGAQHVRIAVKDYGPGIPEQFRSRIFTRFSQADGSDTRAKGGTGLGLAISKAIIESMGGMLGYDTAVNIGTTFYFDLPLCADTASTAAQCEPLRKKG